jgi:hypothetical protein
VKIIENKALLLNLRNPKRITEVIPKARELPNNQVLVRWGLDEAHVLKNLKIRNVPSPILGNYKWPGKHKPYAHQTDTASFLTQRAGYGQDRICYLGCGLSDDAGENQTHPHHLPTVHHGLSVG